MNDLSLSSHYGVTHFVFNGSTIPYS